MIWDDTEYALAELEGAERGAKDGTAAAEEWAGYQAWTHEFAAFIKMGTDMSAYEPLEQFPFLDLSGQWAGGPDFQSLVKELTAKIPGYDYDQDEGLTQVGAAAVDAYQDAYDKAVIEVLKVRADAVLGKEGD